MPAKMWVNIWLRQQYWVRIMWSRISDKHRNVCKTQNRHYCFLFKKIFNSLPCCCRCLYAYLSITSLFNDASISNLLCWFFHVYWMSTRKYSYILFQSCRACCTALLLLLYGTKEPVCLAWFFDAIYYCSTTKFKMSVY